jgi:hypothetical protein
MLPDFVKQQVVREGRFAKVSVAGSNFVVRSERSAAAYGVAESCRRPHKGDAIGARIKFAPHFHQARPNQIHDDYCKGRGLCAQCPCGAIDMVPEPA